MAKKPAARKQVAKRPTPKASKGRPVGLFTWLAVGLVVVVVAALVIIKVTTSSATTSGSSSFQATDATTVSELTTIPATVFNTIGATSPVSPVTPPQSLAGQPALTAKDANGKTVPEVFYLGAEYCPFCAAQRWPTIIALSRFGTWSGLGNMSSSSIDVYPSTPTFTFVKAKYSSPYLVFKSVEIETNIYDSSTGSYGKLQTPTATEKALFDKYDTSTYIKGLSSSDNGSIPFMSIDNKFLVSGASYTPATLQSLSRTSIAQALQTTTSPVTEAIITSANYLTAAICSVTGEMPSNVCTSTGVLAAKKAMKL